MLHNKLDLQRRIRVAMGLESADILFRNAKVVSTFTEEVFVSDIAIANGKIVALGGVTRASTIIDASNYYVCPALIDAHIHIESSMLTPEGFSEAVAPHGTGTVISDPHEIANVFGLKGLKYMLRAAKDLPIEILYGIPSCVPATAMETTGGSISPEDIREAYRMNPKAIVLSEMMNYPGVCFCVDDVLDKICIAQELGLPIDGHSPMIGHQQLNAYLNPGILTDHECMTIEEAREKLRRGMHILMREGSAAQNLRDLLPILTDATAHRIAIASDDRHPDDLLHKGHLDYTWKLMIEAGISPIRALRLLTLNPATIYGLQDRGGIGVGYQADFFIIDNLQRPEIREVYHRGLLVAKDGELLQHVPRKPNQDVMSSVRLPVNLEASLKKFPRQGKVHAIGIIHGQIVTESLIAQAEDIKESMIQQVTNKDDITNAAISLTNTRHIDTTSSQTKKHGITSAETNKYAISPSSDVDLAYLAVVSRYGKNDNVGLGFVQNFGLQKGCLASTVAHDNHNLILLGKSISDMLLAAKTIETMGGGFAFVQDGKVLASVALPIAGLMSPETAVEISEKLHILQTTCTNAGLTLHSPFMTLSFLALSVIPHLKLTDKGLIDVDKFTIIPLEISTVV